VTFPEEYHAKELAGKPATFKVKVHEIKEKRLPALDDEFAKDVDDEVETLEQLKDKIRKRLEEMKKNEAEAALRDAVVEKAAENAEIDIPEVMVKNETDRMLREFDQRLQMQGLNLELYYQFSGQDEAALREQMKEDAEKRVRVALTIEAIAKAENIEVTEEEINEELEKMAKAYNLEVEKLKELLGNLDGVKEDLKWRKTIDFLVENSKVAA
jgi:trigger factor